MHLIPKNRRILTEIENIINESIWPFFEKKSKIGLWKYFWGSLHEGLKLVYSNSYDLVSVQEDFKIFIGKRWRTSMLTFLNELLF